MARERGRKLLRISRDRDDQNKKTKNKKSLGLQTKPKKIPGPQFNPQKTPSRILEPSQFPGERRGRDTRELYHYIMNLQIVFNNQKNPFLNQASQKLLAKIFLPQKILRSSLSPEIRRTPPGENGQHSSSVYLIIFVA